MQKNMLRKWEKNEKRYRIRLYKLLWTALNESVDYFTKQPPKIDPSYDN